MENVAAVVLAILMAAQSYAVPALPPSPPVQASTAVVAEQPAPPVASSVAASTPASSVAAQPVPPVSSASQASSTPASSVGSSASAASASSTSSSAEPISAQASTPAGEYLSTVENAVITHMNNERQAQGLGTLQYNATLTQAARVRAEELFRTDHWAHTRPDGRSWVTVLQVDVPYDYHYCGENLAYLETTNRSDESHTSGYYWFNEWKNSPTHYENIIRPEFTECGVGIYKANVNGTIYVYAVTIFGTPS